jgi:hypothetical protein
MVSIAALLSEVLFEENRMGVVGPNGAPLFYIIGFSGIVGFGLVITGPLYYWILNPLLVWFYQLLTS